MTVTLYDNVCTPCVRKALWKQLRSKAADKRELLSRKDIRKDRQARFDANVTYALPTPFIVDERGVAMSVEEFLNA